MGRIVYRTTDATMINHSNVLIVGAGIAGLLAARVLHERGITTLVLDKGRRAGGRMATRRLDNAYGDNGAQFFTTRDPVFGAYVQGWIAEGRVFEWSRGWSDGSANSAPDGHPRYAVHGGMNALPGMLAQGLDVRVNITLKLVRQTGDGWEAEDTDGKRYTASALLLTPPVPQSLALLEAGGVTLPEAQHQALAAISYAPCFAALFHVEGRVNLPAPGALQRPDGPIYWIADNQRKGVSPDACIITMHAGPEVSRQWYDDPEAEILQRFEAELQPLMAEDARIVGSNLKRWRYAQPVTVYPERCLLVEGESPVAFAGDAFGSPRVEGAALSGIAAGEALAALSET